MESCLDLKVIISEHLLAGRWDAASIVVKNADSDQVKEHAWDLVPTVCEYVTCEQNHQNPDVTTASEEILNHLATVANVKELLIVLLEQLNSADDDVKFKVLLKPIQTCLLTLPGNKVHSVGIALETLYSHVKGLALPEDQKLEGKERILLDLDEDVVRSNDVVYSFLRFMEPLVAELSWRKGKHEERQKQRKLITELTKYLVRVLDHPLAYLDLTHREQGSGDKEAPPKSASRLCAEKAMAMLGQLNGNFPHTVVTLLEDNEQVDRRRERRTKEVRDAQESGEQVDEMDTYNVEDTVPVLGLGVFCYLAFGERLEPDCIPQVFSGQYLLEVNCVFITQLLNQNVNLIIHKGLLLLLRLQTAILDQSFSGLILEAGAVKDLIHVLVKVITSAKVKELSQIAVGLLKSLLKKFDLEGRNQFLFYLLNTMKHSGLTGYVTNLIKDEIDSNLKLSPPSASFTGPKLWRLLDLVFVLPAGDRSDLLENVDRIMGALNMLRYLVIRDKPADNLTGVWSHVPEIRSKYCEVLHKGINLSRVHYELELKNTKKGGRRAGPDTSFSVGGQAMSGMHKEQEVQAIEMALHTFDMMESILGRVSELCDQQHKVKHKPDAEPSGLS